MFEVPDALLRSEGELDQPRLSSLYGNGDPERDGDGKCVSKWWLSWLRRSWLDEDALLLAGFNEHSAQLWRTGLPSLECFGHGSVMEFVFGNDKREQLFSFSRKW